MTNKVPNLLEIETPCCATEGLNQLPDQLEIAKIASYLSDRRYGQNVPISGRSFFGVAANGNGGAQ